MVAGWDDSQYGPSFTEKAVAFIAKHQANQTDKPFFLYFPSQAPHRPCVPPDFVRGKSKAGRRGDMVMEFDWSVGQILKTLQRHKLAENTIVIVTSDNGATPGDTFPPGSKNRNGNIFGKTFGHKSCGPWRGYKSQIWEGGHRVPLIVRWPKKVAQASVSHELVCLTDVIATVADVLESKLPTGAGPDSISFLPALLGKTTNSSDRAVIHHDYSGRFAIRQSDWKYVAPFAKARHGIENGALLFNLKDDPAESGNVIAKQPDVAKRLARLLAKYRTADRSP
jgi:arylsulfatase A